MTGWTDESWEQLWQNEMSVEDVFQIISPDQVRRIRSKYPENLRLLIKKVLDPRVAETMHDRNRRPQAVGIMDVASQGQQPPRGTYMWSQIAARIITRIM